MSEKTEDPAVRTLLNVASRAQAFQAELNTIFQPSPDTLATVQQAATRLSSAMEHYQKGSYPLNAEQHDVLVLCNYVLGLS